jgi:hypothetical protein
MPQDSWYPFDNSGTLGHAGSEGGLILRDEEHSAGARITLEKGSAIAPYAITCGIYGHMVRTRFFSLEDEANPQCDQMKNALSAIFESGDGSTEADSSTFSQRITAFIEAYP